MDHRTINMIFTSYILSCPTFFRLCIDTYMLERLTVANSLSSAVHCMSLEAARINPSLTLTICRAIGSLVRGGMGNASFEEVCRVLSHAMEAHANPFCHALSISILTESSKVNVHHQLLNKQ